MEAVWRTALALLADEVADVGGQPGQPGGEVGGERVGLRALQQREGGPPPQGLIQG